VDHAHRLTSLSWSVRQAREHGRAAAHHIAGPGGQCCQEPELGGSQLLEPLTHAGRVRRRVEAKIREGRRSRVVAAAQQRAHAHDQLDEGEWLRDVVVAAGVEAGHAVGSASSSHSPMRAAVIPADDG
jgi:hypothetical protein